MANLTINSEQVSALTIEKDSIALGIEVNNSTLVLSQSGTKGTTGDTGQGFDIAQTSYYLFQRAGITSNDDNLFPNLITKADFDGITGATSVINRNAGNNLIIDSIVDTYDYDSLHYVWTTPYLGGTDLLANRPGTPSVVIT